MNQNITLCKRDSGGSWRCPLPALDGYAYCEKHQLQYQRKRKRMPIEQMYIKVDTLTLKRGSSRLKEDDHVTAATERRPGRPSEAVTLDSLGISVFSKVDEAPKRNRGRPRKTVQEEHLSENVGQPDDKAEDLIHVKKRRRTVACSDEEDKDPSIANYIAYKAEELREAVDRSISEKTHALQNMILREITKCAFETTSDKKIVTRFKLPFFQRRLESWKYKYSLNWIEACGKQARENLTPVMDNIGVVDLQKKDIATLKPGGWLSAGVIRAYATLITDASKRSSVEGTPTVYIVNPLFYKTSRDPEDGYSVQINDLLKDLEKYSSTQTKILIPSNFGESHWGLIMVDVNALTITVLDPKFSRKEAVKNYKYAVKAVAQHLPDGNKWLMKTCPKDLPKHSNDYDCGLFILAYMECISRGISFDFDLDVSDSRAVICSDFLDYILTDQ